MPKKESPQLKKDVQGRLTNDGMTRKEVAEVMQISRSQVNTIERKALRKLRSRLKLVYNKEDFL